VIIRNLLRVLLLAVSTFGLPVVALAQCTPNSNPAFTGSGTVFGRTSTQWNQYLGAKVSIDNGFACNLTIGGALTLQGGTLTLGGSLNMGTNDITGTGSILSTSLILGVQQLTQGSFTLANTAAGAYSTTLQSSNSATAAYTLTFPPAPPVGNGYALTAATDGTLSWSSSLPDLDLGGLLTTGGALTFVNMTTANQLLYTSSAGNVGMLAVGSGLVLGGSGTNTPLVAANNLNDVLSAATARTNLAITPHVATDAALTASTIAAFPNGVLRDGFTTAGDAPQLPFLPESGACSANSRVNDGGSCRNEASGNSFYAVFPASGAPISEWGGDKSGVASALTAAQAAVTAMAGSSIPVLVDGIYKIPSPGLVVPANTVLQFAATPPQANLAPYSGPYFLCDNQTAYTCITLSGTPKGSSNTNGTQQANGPTIVGTPGSVPVSGSKGIVVSQGIGATLLNPNVRNFDTCYEFDASNYTGYNATIINPQMNLCATHHWVFNGWAVAYIFGGVTDDTGAYSGSQDFVLYENTGCTTSGCGPNTIIFNGHVFLSSSAVPPACAFRWANWNGDGLTDEFGFLGQTRVEENNATTGPFFCTDSSITLLSNLVVDNTTISNDNAAGATQQIFNLNGATKTLGWDIHNSFLKGDITLAPTGTGGLIDDDFGSLRGINAVSLTAPSGDTQARLVFNNTTLSGALTIAGPWQRLVMLGDGVPSNVIDSATGTVQFNEEPQSWTPVLNTGGALTGWTQSGSGTINRTANGTISGTFSITITGKSGITVGTATIVGLPNNPYCNSGNMAPSPLATASGGLASLTATPVVQMNTGSPGTMTLLQPTSSGWANLTDANITSSATLAGSFTCLAPK